MSDANPPVLRYDRIYRTSSSEAYLLSLGEVPIGRLDLHYAQGVVFGLLLLEEEVDADGIHALTAQLDDDLVWTAGVAREDLVLSVYVGHELGTFDDDARAEHEGSRNGNDQ